MHVHIAASHCAGYVIIQHSIEHVAHTMRCYSGIHTCNADTATAAKTYLDIAVRGAGRGNASTLVARPKSAQRIALAAEICVVTVALGFLCH